MLKFSKYLLINICIVGIIGFLFNKPSHNNGPYAGPHADLGLALMLLSLPMLLAGLIVTIAAKDKTYGASMLATGGLLILIGFGVCTI
jgi:hypothetical protein